MNPSIGFNRDGDLLLTLRSVNYVLYCNENLQVFPSRQGPLQYTVPENDVALRTQNYLALLDTDFSITNISWVDTSTLDVAPLWNFSGHEDARIIAWGGKLYLTGVRRDTTTNGQGRMELSEIEIDKKNWKVTEVNRIRVPAPGANDTYCEKNWMPILGSEFKYLKWSDPTEIVQVELSQQVASCNTISLKEGVKPPKDQRGSTHVLPWNSYFIAITHEVDLIFNYLNQKNARYRHRLCVWDSDFSLVGFTEAFSFLDARIEFACGMVSVGDKLLVSFGYDDNSAFLLEIPNSFVDHLVERALSNVS